jgi:hypothetical protein
VVIIIKDSYLIALGCMVSLDGGANKDVKLKELLPNLDPYGLHIRFIREQKLEYLKAIL